MNLDFHYYGTYCAAMEAGYAKEEAKKIAYFAQFVDECSATLLDKNGIKKGNALFVPTVQSEIELLSPLKSSSEFTKDEIRTISKIWAPFHFLPGNTTGTEVKYDGPEKYVPNFIKKSLKIQEWNNNASERKKFHLLCLPNSDLVVDMVECIREDVNGIGLTNKLEHIGMAMHVLADTWAHYWFAGTPAWHINDAEGTVYEHLEDGSKRSLLYIYDFVFKDNIEAGHYSCSPINIHYNGICYLGHGRMGHLPDYSFITYDYIPMWKAGDGTKGSQRVLKNNPNVFMSAYTQMVYALRCIKENRPFQVEEYYKLEDGDRIGIRNILKTRKLDTSMEWKDYIKNKGYDEPAAFSAQAVFTAYQNAVDKTNTDLVRFLHAASGHAETVERNVLSKCLE